MTDQSNTYETFYPQARDDQGRLLGYVVGLRELDTGECYAWVQRVIRVEAGTWKNRGAFQRSRQFPSLQAAQAWAYPEAKRRMAL